MPDWLFYAVTAAILGFTLFAAGWIVASFRRERKKWQAEHDAWMEAERAKMAKNTADIFAKPAGSKSDIISRL